MESTSENKARFFAQYYGQKAMWVKAKYPHKIGEIIPNDFIVLQFFLDKTVLLLKPLSTISDEDATEVLKILSARGDSFQDFNRKENLLRIFDGEHLYKTIDPYMFSNSIQYLQSKGYALPYMGLSVDQLVNYGWIRVNRLS